MSNVEPVIFELYRMPLHLNPVREVPNGNVTYRNRVNRCLSVLRREYGKKPYVGTVDFAGMNELLGAPDHSPRINLLQYNLLYEAYCLLQHGRRRNQRIFTHMPQPKLERLVWRESLHQTRTVGVAELDKTVLEILSQLRGILVDENSITMI